MSGALCKPPLMGCCRYRIVALHSTLSSKDQAAAFTVPPAGSRKVLLNVL